MKIMKCQPKEAMKESGKFDLYFSALPLGDDLEHEMVQEGDTYAAAFVPSLARRIYGDRWPELEKKLIETENLSVLKEMPYVLLTSRIGEFVLDLQMVFAHAGFDPVVSFHSENSELNANMCALGSGVYIGTMDNCLRRFHNYIGEDKPDGILLYPIESGIDPIGVSLSHRKGKRLNKGDKAFIETTKKYLKESI